MEQRALLFLKKRLKAMNKKIYVTPVIEVEALECATVIAASFGIELGGEIGKGDHKLPGGAKEAYYVCEEDFEEEYFEEEYDPYAPFPTW